MTSFMVTGNEPFRIMPQMPVRCYQTYTIAIPLNTHWRAASCDEVDCVHYMQGWITQIDEATELGQQQGHYIRHDKSRRHFEEKTPEGLTSFRFPPGQRCFQSSDHRVQNGRPERYIRRDGDWRGNPTGVRHELSVTSWLDDFGEHQEVLSDKYKEG